MYCTECGRRLEDEGNYCPYCGTKRTMSNPAKPTEVTIPPKKGAMLIRFTLVLVLCCAVMYFLTQIYSCDRCHKDYVGASYFDMYGEGTMCKECAQNYWYPFPIDSAKQTFRPLN